jgi:Cupin
MKSRSPSIPDVFARQDPLGQALESLRTSAAFYVNSEFTGPWGLDIPPLDGCLMFHMLMSGSCSLVVGEDEAVGMMRNARSARGLTARDS